jgi:hypothetical protein
MYLTQVTAKSLPVLVFPNVNVPLCSAAQNTPIGITARYSPKKTGMSLRFKYLLRFVITSCGLFCAFRHDLISDLTLPPARHLISAYVPKHGLRENPTRVSLTFVEGGRVFPSFRLASCRGVVLEAIQCTIIARYSAGICDFILIYLL